MYNTLDGKTFIIAEAGVNHNGSLDLAKQLVDAAVNADADSVKFQTFKAEKMVTKSTVQAEYQAVNTGVTESQYDMLKRLELSFDDFIELKNYCDSKNIEFMTTAFDHESLHFIVKDLGVKRFKIPSGDITNGPLILEHAKYKLPIILSTGMAALAEIETALGVIAFGLLGKEKPSLSAFEEAYYSDEGQAVLKEYVTILHCTSQYPAPFHEVNLRCMKTFKTAFSLPSGYSDHTNGIAIPVAAIAMGAAVIEKHFTLDKTMDGPDHKASLDPTELKQMISSIRQVEMAMGDGVKKPTVSELKTRDVARKSLVAECDIKNSESYKSKLAVKRPGTGISPMRYWEVQERIAIKAMNEGELIED
jgi:N-acetylneuraminate synthase